jgi:transcriptional regulator with XRE-family HTH domain
MDLSKQLGKLQRERGLSDRDFAKLLGTSSGMWNQIKNGEREMGRKLLAGVLAAFPELEQSVLQYLRAAQPQETEVA